MADAEPFDLGALLLPRKSIPAETRRRLSPYIFESISPKLQEEYEEAGWVLDKKLKSKVKMRKVKSHDTAFEDRVWATMAKLSFQDLNKDRRCRVPYGPQPNEAQQIDVLAADDEAVLLIECKSAAEVTSGVTFKKDVEAIQGRRAGIIKEVKKRYPDHKIKFILATNNFGLSSETVDRITSADIIHMDEDAIDYFLSLAEHLGKASRYQLLGYLFEGMKIPGIEARVPAIQGKMGGHTYYSFAIEPERLLKLSYILHRNKANSVLMPTYQRLIKKSRLKKVSEFVDDGGFFPNSIILNVDRGGKPLRFERAQQPPGSEAKIGILYLPQTYRAAYVIDGQHRLYGYAGSQRASTDLIPVVAFEGLPRSEQVRLFMQINENQQAVPKNLRNTLNADLLWDSDDLREQIRALKLRIAAHLGEHKSSPLYGRIIIGENLRTVTRCITIDAISTGLERGNFLGSFTKKEMREAGTFYRGTNDATFKILPRFLELCFAHIRAGVPLQWDLGNATGGFVFINSGIDSLLRVFSDLVDHVVANEGVKPSEETAESMFSMIEPWLDALVTFLNGLGPEEAAEFRRMYGSGGPTRYWRQLLIAINSADPQFSPPGFADYLRDQKRQFNTESFEMIRDIEQFMNADIRRRLEDHYGARWLKDGVPFKVLTDATQLSLEKNRTRDPDDELEPWACLHLIDYQKIVTASHELWQDLFMKQYTRPGEEKKSGGWKSRADWMIELNRIRNQNDHDYIVSEEEYEFLVSIKTWLVDGQAENVL